MQIVIDISKELYDYIQDEKYDEHLDKRFDFQIRHAVANAVLLPKGHGRLIEDNFKIGPVFDKEGNLMGYQYVTQEDLDNAPTIIEADKESEQ